MALCGNLPRKPSRAVLSKFSRLIDWFKFGFETWWYTIRNTWNNRKECSTWPVLSQVHPIHLIKDYSLEVCPLSVFPLYFISKRLFKSSKAVYSTSSQHSGRLIQEFQWIINYLRFVWMDSRYGQDLLEMNIEWT